MTTGAHNAIFYDGLTSKPHEATVRIAEHDVLDVRYGHERILWPLEEKGMRWERGREQVRITFGDFPRRVIISRDAEFNKAFAVAMGKAGRRGPYDKILSTARAAPVIFFIGVIAVLAAGYFWVIPWSAERLALLMPHELDRRLGEMVMGSMVLGMEEDSARSVVLQEFGDRLQLGKEFDLRFHVVEDAQVNAFALPGGDIVVFTGILEKMEDPRELSALLAHEAMHVEERHSTRLLVRQAAGFMFISLLLGDISGVVAIVAENADNLRNMSFSRNLESDADLLGMEALQASGHDPYAMVELLEFLGQEAQDMPDRLAFLSSHPLTTERVEQAKEKVNELGPGPNGLQDNSELWELFEELQCD